MELVTCSLPSGFFLSGFLTEILCAFFYLFKFPAHILMFYVSGEPVIRKNSAVLTFSYTFFLSQTALVSPNEKQFDLLQRRLKERLEDGRGETIFDVGVGEGMCTDSW